MDDSFSSCTILWSTQSGRAKACARRVARILQEQTTVKVTVGGQVDEFSFLDKILASNGQQQQQQDNHLWLFLVSTTGDGEQCDSIRQTWKSLLNKSLPNTLLDKHKFALFALGDRAYGPQFCAAGRKFAARLVQLGAQPSCAIGYGDDGTPNGGVFSDLDVWIDNTLLPLLPTRSVPLNSSLTAGVECLYSVSLSGAQAQVPLDTREWLSQEYRSDYQQFFSKSCPLTAYVYNKSLASDKVPLVGECVSNERITAATWEQNTRHICINVNGTRAGTESHSSLPYQAGDVATVFPENCREVVEKLLRVLPESIQSMVDVDLNIDTIGSTNESNVIPWPTRCTLRGLLTYCADIQALPEREDLRVLARYCDLEHPMGSDQRDKLLSLSDTSGAALYADYVLREKRCWADVLYDFDSIQLTVESLLTLLPAMRPRHFSIASAPSQIVEHVNSGSFRVELCVAVVEGSTPLGRSYHGLCSNYLAMLEQKAPIKMWIQPGSFGKLPLDLSREKGGFVTPILCIGSGTGIAPLRSLLLEREAVFDKAKAEGAFRSSECEDACNNILVFGCRKESKDYYYREDWDSLVNEKRLLVWTAFSRDQWHKIYVQQVLRGANGGKLVEEHILQRQGAIYVAGGAKMARCVRDEILECLASAVGGEKQAALVLKRMNLQGRYSVEAWS